ncbi:branched-chain amino acid transport system II carrier protein [Muriicola soli]|uniref:Branched-chain amino acid transport system II carrier protein n=1 Tax=Muriicola soli TaxID=2507538 RepID=A0A411ECV3_9FLAO|nr:branched-chain amino acid transport system II carrier protein [Muriicola soli]QBA65458.1 branched-chain amino acid transport system II carrier protein [Muriicola soli]
MRQLRELLVTAFALFSLFFGAGNLILPPQLGFKAGSDWWIVAMGFALSAVFIPILGIRAHAKLQGTMFDFALKVSPKFSLIYCFVVYAISISLPSPRTASVAHEMAVSTFFEISPITTSFIYFALVLIFALNRNKILDIIGKLMTPAILLILLAIIGIVIFAEPFDFGASTIKNPVSYAILEGYQTFDAIGAVVVGGVIIVSINLKGRGSYEDKKKLIANAGWVAGITLFLVYTGLIISAGLMHSSFDSEISRTDLLQQISFYALGNTGKGIFAVLVALACFTTAVGVVTGTGDFVKSRFANSQKAYVITVIIGSILGVLMGQMEVGYIIDVALPALMFIYPITIVLIVLNVLPEKWTSKLVFRSVVGITILFSIPDFLGSLALGYDLSSFNNFIPFSSAQLGWLVPSCITLLAANLYRILRSKKTK